MREEPVIFGGKTALVGIVADPEGEIDRNLPAVILLNAGGLHRVGPNRLYVSLARRMAGLGFVVLRFDFSGFGDSEARCDDTPFAKVAVSEVQSAMDFLTTTRGSEQFVLMGICSGAEVSFDVAQRDPRVAGAVLINGSGYDVASVLTFDTGRFSFLFRTIRFLFTAWPQILVRKMTRGTWGAKYTAELSLYLLRNLIAGGSHEDSDADGLKTLAKRGTEILLVYEGGTPITHYLQALLGAREPRGDSHAVINVMKRADHTFNSVRQQEMLLDLICNWATVHCGFASLEQVYKPVAIGL